MHLESASNQIQALYTQYEQDRLLPDHEFQAKALQVAQNAETILEELFKDISKVVSRI